MRTVALAAVCPPSAQEDSGTEADRHQDRRASPFPPVPTQHTKKMASRSTIRHPFAAGHEDDRGDSDGRGRRDDVCENGGGSVDGVATRRTQVSPLPSGGAASLDVDVGSLPATTDSAARETPRDVSSSVSLFPHTNSVVQFSGDRVRYPGGVSLLDRRMARQVASGYLDHWVSVERFPPGADSSVPFHRRSTAKIRRFADDFLPRHPVYVLNAGESFRIRITIGRDGRLSFPLSEVVSVKVIPPDGEGQSVEVWQRNREHALDALGLIEPDKFGSKRLNTTCPVFGLVDAKYVKLTVHVKFRLGDGFPHEMDVYPNVYLRIRRPPRLLKLLEKLRGWKRATTGTLGARQKSKRRQ